MTGEEEGEKAVTQSGSPVDNRAGIAGTPREDQAGPAASSERDGGVTTPTNQSIAALEQWLCLLLGVSCMVCGVWGICMKSSQGLSSGYAQWLGSAYGPALRLTALACLAFGAVLVGLGLARPGRSSGSDNPQSVATCRQEPRAPCKSASRSAGDFTRCVERERKELT
jgi:hypothetical protein